MHDLPAAGSRRIGRTTSLVAVLIAVALLVLTPLVPAAPWLRRSRAPPTRASSRGSRESPRSTARSTATCRTGGSIPGPSIDSTTTSISTIAFFGLGIKKDGNIDTAWRGYTAYLSANAVAVTNAAHAKGVRVVPTFQLFDSGTLPKMSAFLHSSAAQARFIRQAVALMLRRSADGANFDFEPMPQSLSLDYAAFLASSGRRCSRRSRAPSSSWRRPPARRYTLIDGIENIVDQMIVMTYNYRWSGSIDHRRDRAARQHDPDGQAPHRPVPRSHARVEADPGRARTTATTGRSPARSRTPGSGRRGRRTAASGA